MLTLTSTLARTLSPMLTRCDEGAARAALTCRGRAFRRMRDELHQMVDSPTERKGSLRDRRTWDVADTLSKVLARASTLQLGGGEPVCAVVPLHDRLAHCDGRGENVKLVVDPVGKGGEALLVATRPIERGEAITRDYNAAPRLVGEVNARQAPRPRGEPDNNSIPIK